MSEPRRLSGVLIGSTSTLPYCAERFLAKGHELVAIVSGDAAVQRWATERELRWLEPDAELARQLQPLEFDYLFSIAHLKIIPNPVLALPRKAAINFHDGILPDYAGLNVPAWAIIHGEREHGVSWHLITAGIDEGDVLLQKRFPIDETETALTLNAKCFEAALHTFDELIDELAAERTTAAAQDLGRRRYFARHQRPRAAGSIDWSQSAASISNLVRGLDFGPYANPLTSAKIWIGQTPVTVTGITCLASESILLPGTVVHLSDEVITVATGTVDVQLRGFSTLLGTPLSAAELSDNLDLREGSVLVTLTPAQEQAISEANAAVAVNEAFWVRLLRGLDPVEIPYARHGPPGASASYATAVFHTPAAFGQAGSSKPGDRLLAALALYLARIGGKAAFDVAFRERGRELSPEAARLVTGMVPLRVAIDWQEAFPVFSARFQKQLGSVRRRGRHALDLIQRQPELAGTTLHWHRELPTVVIERVGSLKEASGSDSELTLEIPDDGRTMGWRYRKDNFDSEDIARMQAQFAVLLEELADSTEAVRDLTIVPATETTLLDAWNRTSVNYAPACLHHLFEAQVERSPEAPALAFRNLTLDYTTLNREANRVAHSLIADGVGPGDLVGILMDRSPEMLFGMLGILKAGAAYVPLDPQYPRDRLGYMVDDAQVSAIVSQTKYAELLPAGPATFIALDELGQTLEQQAATNPITAVQPDDLAYVIYTSGSTGKPKGVMVEHRNVANFFTGMDARIGAEGPGVWLAVTSISFDISVLEIFWTLARGFKVVLYDGDDQGHPNDEARKHQQQPMGFSLFYFASDEGENAGRAKYDLLLEGARYADRHGFQALWTPERHFHAFGGLYPNPSVASAAIAAITENVRIRAGSCVLPLHSPIRIAEEWALVDNISNGRVGISFAAGWQPNDFVLAPQNYDERLEVFYEGIDTVRALWRGESRSFPGPKGDTEIQILPRPVQAELPFWVTAAGNPETFRKAGAIGANMLTHLLGQSIDELAGKLEIYRQARRDHGHEGPGHVTLMLHTFVAEDEAFVRSQVHGPLTDYLRSATNLVKQYASAFPAFKHAKGADVDDIFQRLSDDDMEALLEHAVERYYETSGLFGTPKGCLAQVDRLKGIGVDEIACLIDFGIPSATVLAQLPQLNTLRELASPPERQSEEYGIPALIEHHDVTHLQCTPTMATMLSKNRRAGEALGRLTTMMVGGEAFPAELARDLRELLRGRLLNMYGPTETTIWSTTHEVEEVGAAVPIGTPIANTRCAIVDQNLTPLPAGLAGELLIGGEGVVRGYLNRPELTAERFVADPLEDGARLYRTGDLARWHEGGPLEFLGRIDHQVKIRGHRIELGEIEATLSRHVGVQQAVVVASEIGSRERRLIAYLVPEAAGAPSSDELKDYLRNDLPDFMVPATFVTLESFPLTPNQKIDRQRLPAPDQQRPDSDILYVGPRTDTERVLTGIFAEVLELERVGIDDNFIALGGDSLAAVEVVLMVEERFGVEFPMYMFFQVLTVEGLAEELARILAETPAGDEMRSEAPFEEP